VPCGKLGNGAFEQVESGGEMLTGGNTQLALLAKATRAINRRNISLTK
jgi:hypothetical protein